MVQSFDSVIGYYGINYQVFVIENSMKYLLKAKDQKYCFYLKFAGNKFTGQGKLFLHLF